jgi:hypothetical protein
LSAVEAVFAVFLIAHGLVHAILAAAPRPDVPDAKPLTFWTRPSKLLPGIVESIARPLATVLWIVSTLLFVTAGLGLLGVPGVSEIWSGLATAGAITSLLLLLIFWHKWLILGVLIDLGLILALVVFSWTPVS